MSTMELVRGDGRLTWQLRITDHAGERRRLSLHTEARGTASRLAMKIEALIDCRVRGDGIPGDLVQWVTGCNKHIRQKLLDWGIVEARAVDGGRTLYAEPVPDPAPPGWEAPPESLVDLWEEDLQAREVTELYAEQSAQRVRVLLALPAGDHKPLRFAGELTAEGVLARIRELRKIGPPVKPGTKRPRKPLGAQTCEHYLAKAREFAAWLVARGYLASNPLAGATAYSPEVIRENKQRQRRALSLEEQQLLLQGTPGLPHRWNMEGVERALLYRLTLRTGLRAEEVQTLKVCQLNFFTRTITLRPADNKARREETLPIAAELVELLKTHVAGKLPQTAVFTWLSHKRYCRMLKDDLEELGIPYKDQMGAYADFHALRHTFGTDLAKVVMPAVHQKLMRHANINTTMKFYTHVEHADKAAALAKLPALPEMPATHERAG